MLFGRFGASLSRALGADPNFRTTAHDGSGPLVPEAGCGRCSGQGIRHRHLAARCVCVANARGGVGAGRRASGSRARVRASVRLCMPSCMHVCMHTHKNMHAHRQTDRQTDKRKSKSKPTHTRAHAPHTRKRIHTNSMHACIYSKETYSYGKRDVFIWQQRPIRTAHKQHACMHLLTRSCMQTYECASAHASAYT